MRMLNIYDKVTLISKHLPVPNLHYLYSHLPIFAVHSSQIKTIGSPDDFYKELINGISKSHKRIVMASLYIGDGYLEKKLVTAINNQQSRKPDLKVSWLLDCNRASRGIKNSRTLLIPSIKENLDKYKVSLYHTPRLRGLLKYFIPDRWNETIGLQHMKVYIFDNSVILTGANLSNDYFTNRQDRYIHVSDGKLADFYENLVEIVANYSMKLQSDNTLEMSSTDASLHPYKGNYKKYCREIGSSLRNFWKNECDKNESKLDDLINMLQDCNEKQSSLLSSSENQSKSPVSCNDMSNKDTLIFPTIQVAHSGITLDSDVTLQFLKQFSKDTTLYLASGYFNLTHRYMDAIINDSNAHFDILCAHPKANGFLGAKGFAGAIPFAYTQLCKLFHTKVLQYKQSQRVFLREYEKENWTFHAKGMWAAVNGSRTPFMTLIGSPNFGSRSVHRDLENQMILCTTSPVLSKELAKERDNLYEQSSLVSGKTFTLPERTVPLWVKLVIPFIRHFF